MRRFWLGLGLGLAAFAVLNLLAAQLASDCGLPGLFGLSGCADDIRRAGFPFLFLEQGGFVARNIFSPAALLADLGVALAVSAALGWWLVRRKAK